ncbi:MAG: hypothetical protein ACKOWF_03455 [Chloroflexota bacterium]
MWPMNVRLSRLRVLAPAFAALLLLAGCSGLGAPEPAPTALLETPTPEPTPTPRQRLRCEDGRLAVGDVAGIAGEWTTGVQDALERARDWRADARLVAIRVGCTPLENAFRWEGRFYSDTAQAFFSSDTRQTTPAELDPRAVVTLPLDRIDFGRLRDVLLAAGYPDDSLLEPASGLIVRLNAPTDPFGPPGTPPDVTYHVAIDQRGEILDLFVSGADWRIYSYDAG